MDKTKEELEACAIRLLKADKPKMVVGAFKDKDIKTLSEKETKHFATAEYLWQATPHNKEDEYKGMHMGVLLDENLNYVHMVFASNAFMYHTFKLKL